MLYDFLVDTYETERLEILSVWSMFQDNEMVVRPNVGDMRGRGILE